MHRLGLLTNMHFDGAIEHKYSWCARHSGVKWYLAGIFVGLIVSQFVYFLKNHSFSIKNYGILLSLMAFAFIIGYAHDFFWGSIKKSNKVLLKSEGIEIFEDQDEGYILLWKDICVIDEFNIHEKRTDNKNTDYWRAMGVGGLRLTDSRGRVFRIYRSIGGFDALRSALLENAPQATLLINGSDKRDRN